jgi:DnaJ-class molecular chaperone
MEYYDILGLPKKASIEEVKKAYKRLVLVHHPDKQTGNRCKFEKLTQAYNVLNDEDTKMVYDASLEISEDHIFKLFDILRHTLGKMRTSKTSNVKEQTTPKSPKGPSSTHMSTKKVDAIKVYIKLTLDEVYRGDIKKVVVRVRRDDTWIKDIFYVNLMEHKSVHKFENRGDEVYGEKGDVNIYVKVLEHDIVKIDNILCEYDLYMEESMSLYDFYYGFQRVIPYLNAEILNIKRDNDGKNDHSNYSYTHVVEGHGLPYIKDADIYYGNLYIYFKLKLPDDLDVMNKDIKELIKTYFNVNNGSLS